MGSPRTVKTPVLSRGCDLMSILLPKALYPVSQQPSAPRDVTTINQLTCPVGVPVNILMLAGPGALP